MTPKRRTAILEGRAYGWASAESAPPRIQQRILEIRQALIEKRPEPPMSAEYRAAADFAQKLFRTPARANQRTVSESTTTNVEKLRRLMDAARIF